MKNILLFTLLLVQCATFSQNKIVTILDASSGETVPYANIKIGTNSNNISDSEGKFSISEANDAGTLIEVSFIGYQTQQLTIGTLEKQNYIIKIVPGVYELSNVDVTDKKEDVLAIMAKVKTSLKENYSSDESAWSNTIFVREQNAFQAKQFNLEIEESTGFSKSKLKDINAEIGRFASQMTKSPPKEFKDFLGLYSYSLVKKDDKMFNSSKLKVLKATTIKDDNRSVSIDDLEKTYSNLFLKHLDTTKFYRVKSGWFGSRDTISFSKEYNKNRNKNKKDAKPEPKNVTVAKSTIFNIQSQANAMYGMKTDFLRQTDWYKYTFDGAVFTDDYKLVYVIKFQPKKGKAKYEGTLYVSESDYAVVKATFNLAKGKTLGGINLKWIMGIKAFENVSSGTLIYKQNTSTKKYYVQYASLEEGQYMYVNRPLKFIELAEEDRDILALDLKVEGNMLDKTEYLNLDQKELTTSEFESLTEPDFKYIRMSKYDPKFYKEFTTMEPVEEMKQFRVTN